MGEAGAMAAEGAPRHPDAPFRRAVFYIPGYDPFPPRRYRELYRRESARQAALSGYRITLAPRRIPGSYGWDTGFEGAEGRAEAEVQVLVWSDLVRRSMDRGIAATYLQLLRTAWIYLSTGALFRLARLRKGPVIAALYPVAMLAGQAGLALLVGLLAARWAALVPGGAGLPAAAAGVAAGIALLHGFRRIDGRLFAHYLMHDFAYSAQRRGANPPALEARMTAFRATIRAALERPVEEVLVVGHSSGAHLAVSILADLLREGGLPQGRRPALSLLTLGQVVPMVSFLPAAGRLRADLHHLSARPEVTWVDVTAPGDGCAFALCDPVAVSGVAPPGARGPLVVSAAFSRTLRDDTWRALRWRFFRLHFQYLCAFDNLPGQRWDYDYFAITAGPLTLADRFAGRPPSASRIERPVSGYRDRAA